jgi:hypothetical protein
MTTEVDIVGVCECKFEDYIKCKIHNKRRIK